MKNLRLTFVMSSLLLGLSTWAQTGNVETTVKECLEQLPTQDSKTYGQTMERLAACGGEGIVLLSSQMDRAGKAQDAKYEYAIGGIVDYTMMKGTEKNRAGIIDGLTQALKACTDNPNRAFLMSELQKCGTAREFRVYCNYLNDAYLQDYAISGIAKLPGVDKKTVKLIKSAKAPREKLAYLAYFKKLKGAEKTLLRWLPEADEKTKASIYMALTTCGSNKSLPILEEAARNVDYKVDATGATDAYLQLKENLGK